MSLLKTLLLRGDKVAVEHGKLVVIAASEKPVPLGWLKSKEAELVSDVLQLTGQSAYRYVGYNTGRYGKGLYQGVTLQFVSSSGGEAYAIFNVSLTRARTTKAGKKGASLPPGQFRITQGHAFYKFWQRSGVAQPKRLSAYHECMGKLKNVIFTLELKANGKVENNSLKPLAISYEELLFAAGLANNKPTISRQITDNFPTEASDKKPSQSYDNQAFEEDLSACEKRHGNKVISKKVNVPSYTPPSSAYSERENLQVTPQEQTVDEWLSSYCGDAIQH